ncbi:hypothetical protein WJX82_001073 [Trebouxia sp. C0006]
MLDIHQDIQKQCCSGSATCHAANTAASARAGPQAIVDVCLNKHRAHMRQPSNGRISTGCSSQCYQHY